MKHEVVLEKPRGAIISAEGFVIKKILPRGTFVEKGEEVAEISNHDATLGVVSPRSGWIGKSYMQVGDGVVWGNTLLDVES